ncbi:MAG: HEAT repeat domain-containing protein [Longimicrobiaceae bacterium]
MTAGVGEAGVLTTDRELVVRSWDAWLEQATGIRAGAACGRPLAELFPEVEARGFLPRLRQVVEEGATQVLAPAFHQYLIPCAPLQPAAHFARMQQHVTLSPLYAGEGVAGVTIVIRDVTARRDGERELAERLRSADGATRLRAAQELAAAEASPDVLVGAFDDADWRVRQVAVEGVASQRGGGVAEVLAGVLREQHRDLAVLNATLSALAASGEDVLPPLLELLRSPGADLRMYVALALGLRGDRRAVPALLGALDDGDANVRFHALEALGRLRARAAAPAVAAVAESRDFSVAFAALDALAEIGDETLTPRILPLLDDELLRPGALAALGRLGGEEVVAPLAALLGREAVPAEEPAGALAAIWARYQEGFGDGEVIARLAAATAPPGAGPRLIGALASARGEDAAALARVLGWLRPEGADEALVRALESFEARGAAVEGLTRLGAGAVDAVVRGLGRLPLEGGGLHAAVLTLGRIGSPAAVPALVGLLHTEPGVAESVAKALGGIADLRAFEPLLGLLDDPRATVRQGAVGAASSLGHPGLRERVAELLGHPAPVVRQSAVAIAGYLGFTELADRIVELCHDEDFDVARAALEHLAHLDHPRTAAVLAEALRSATAVTRWAAARAAAALAPADAGPLLSAALADGDVWVRYFAARSAGALGLAPLGPTLAEIAVHDPAVPPRIAAITALKSAGGPGSVPVLLSLVHDPEEDVALNAWSTLGRSTHPDALRALGEAVASGDPDVQRVALQGLNPRAAAALAEEIARVARATGDDRVGTSALFALQEAGSAGAIRLLCGLAAEPRLRERCVQLLAGFPGEQDEVLGEELRQGGEEAREAILDALAHRPGPAAERLAAAALDDPSPRVRRAAGHALLRLDLRAAAGRTRE